MNDNPSLEPNIDTTFDNVDTLEPTSNMMNIFNDFIHEIISQLRKSNAKEKFRQDIISPLLDILFKELYPYTCFLVVLMSITLLLCVLSFIILLILYINYKNKL